MSSCKNTVMIIYNNKMEISQEKLNDFYKHYFGHHSLQQSQQDMPDQLFFSKCGVDLKLYKSPTMNYIKPIKDYGFLKRYDAICNAMPYISALRPEQVEVQLILSIIQNIYKYYNGFAKKGLWKVKQHQSYLQQFTLLYLHELYMYDVKLKRKYFQFDKFLINIFFSLNILKTCNNNIKSFTNFLHSSYSFSELFLYLCLKNISIISNNQEMIKSKMLRKVIKVFQATDQTNYVSGYLSEDSVQNQDDKLVSINTIFVQPLGGSLSFPKVKMYKIMKICKYTGHEQNEEIQWGEFLKQYFDILQNGSQICFEHIVASAVAKSTYELSNKLLQDEQKQVKEKFLQEAFSYVFQILSAVFAEHQPEVPDQRTCQNLRNLRKHYSYMKRLGEQSITIMNKFCKKILKNNYVLELYKNYS